jgi:hypothetical protein
MAKPQHPPSGPLKDSGLSDDWSKGYSTYFSHVTLTPGKTVEKFYDFLNHAMTTSPLKGDVSSGDLNLHTVAVVYGTADVIIVWQAKNDKAAKDFRNTVLAGDGHRSQTMYCSSGDGHNG